MFVAHSRFWCGRVALLMMLMSNVEVAPLLAQQADEAKAAAHALDSIFNVRRAPEAKAMGILKGSFLDALANSGRKIQVGFVIDVSESMSDQLPAIRNVLPNLYEDIRRAAQSNVEFALVAASDTGNPAGAVEILNRTFVSDVKNVTTLAEKLQPRTGRPYFLEPIDLAVHRAIMELPWDEEAETERWLFVIGDAPPYPANFNEEKYAAKRWYSEDRLVELAQQKGIKIHALLCNSRASERDAAMAVIDQTRLFFSTLATETEGMMLDLSYDDVRQEIVEAAQRERTEFTNIGYLTPERLATAKQRYIPDFSTKVPSKVRVAICPHMPWDQMTFLHNQAAVQLATEYRQILQRVPGMRFASTRQMETELDLLKDEGIPVDEWPQALCYRLNVDYLIHGQLLIRRGEVDVLTSFYEADRKSPFHQVRTSGSAQTAVAELLANLMTGEARNDQHSVWISLLSSGLDVKELAQVQQQCFAELSAQERGMLLSALNLMEGFVESPWDDQSQLAKLEQAESYLQQVTLNHPKHAYAHTLLASCYFNQAKMLEAMGTTQQDQHRTVFKQALEAIEHAHAGVEQVPDQLMRWEIKADYQLLVKQNASAAADLYQKITQFNNNSNWGQSLRAHWMLAGIYAGDWQVAEVSPEIVNTEKTLEHLAEIIVGWPDSNESYAIHKYLMLDDKTDTNRSPYFPLEGNLFITQND